MHGTYPRSPMSSYSPTTAKTRNVSQKVRSTTSLSYNSSSHCSFIDETALPSKPLNSIALYDADSASALQFVKQRLHESGIDADFSEKETAYVERLGGRASDLASVRSLLCFPDILPSTCSITPYWALLTLTPSVDSQSPWRTAGGGCGG